MDARIVGPEAELGDVRSGVPFYGHTLTREWSKVDFSGDALAKARGNKFVELRDGKGKAADSTVPQETEEHTVKARLGELGVDFTDKEKLSALKSKLEKAEKAQAQAEEEADAAEAAAREAAEAAGRTDQQ